MTTMITRKKQSALPRWAVVFKKEAGWFSEYRDAEHVFWSSAIHPTADAAKEAARAYCHDEGLDMPEHFHADIAENAYRAKRVAF